MNLEKLKDNLVTYEAYCRQILRWEEESFTRKWQIPESLLNKVDKNGKFQPFFGDTTVVILPRTLREELHRLQQNIERRSPFFAESLNYNLFHITVHDLNNSPHENEVKHLLEITREKTIEVLKTYKKRYPAGNTIKLKSTSIFPAGHTGLVLGFLPSSNEDYQKFLELYNLLEKIVPLDYWPNPHVTLNYFSHSGPSLPELKKLNKVDLEIELDLTQTVYQRFTNMNSYLTF